MEVPEEQMTIPRAADKALRALAVTLPCIQNPEVFDQCRASLAEGLRSLGLPHTSLVGGAAFNFVFSSVFLIMYLYFVEEFLEF